MPAQLVDSLELDVEAFLEAEGGAFSRPRLRALAVWALREAGLLIRPALTYEWFPVSRGVGDRVTVGGVTLHLGRHAQLLDRAVEALAGVATIGPLLEEKARALGQQGRTLEAYVLGEAGIFAVGVLAKRLHRIAEEEAARRGWGVSAELAPGQLAGWDVREQVLLCDLLDLATIGVAVTETGLLVPEKSVSLLVGVGPEYEASKVESPCRYCARAGECRWKH